METDGGGRRTLARRYGICKHASALYSNGGTFWAVPCSQQIFPPRTIGSVAFFGGGAPAHGSASFPLLHHAVSMPRSSSSHEASDFRSGALPLPFSGHSISFARLPVLLFSGHLPVFPRENAFSNNFQKNAAFWENPENIWLKFGQNSAKFWEILQNFVKISEIFSDF